MQQGPGHLRPRNLPEILDGAVRHFRSRMLSFIIPFVPMALLDVVAAIGAASLLISLFTLPEFGPGPDPAEIFTWLGLGSLYLLVRGGAFMLGAGATIFMAGTELGGKAVTLTEAWEMTRRRIWPLLAVGILYSVAVGVGFVLFLLPGLYLMIALAFCAHALLLEGAGVMDSLGRSRDLVRDHFWRAVGMWVFIFVVNTALGTLSNVLSEVANLFLEDDGSGAAPFLALTGASFLVATLVGLFLTPLYSVLYTHFYWDIRVRKEGLDLDTKLESLEGGPAS